MRRKRLPIILYLICLFILIFIMTAFYKSAIFLYLLFCILLLVPVSYLLCKAVSRNLKVEMTVPATAYAGETVLLTFGVCNPLRIPHPACRIHFTISSPFYPCTVRREAVLPVFAGKSSTFSFSIKMDKSACYNVLLERLQIMDYLSLFSFEQNLEDRKEIFVSPQVRVLETLPPLLGTDEQEEEETEDLARAKQSSDLINLREYRPGDRIHRIHWKLSAKRKQLIVREHGFVEERGVTLLMELCQPFAQSNALENTLTYCFSLVSWLFEQKRPFRLLYYRTDLRRITAHQVYSKVDFDRAIRECFLSASYSDYDLALSVVRETGALNGGFIHISEKGILVIYD